MGRYQRNWKLPTIAALLALGLAATSATAKKVDPDGKKENGLPLEPTGTFSLTTDEVTWLSLDVSPDGESMVLEILGDLYTLPIAGGDATRITNGLAFDSQPSFSPDGNHIAFVSDRDGSENLWIANADGTDAEKLSSTSSHGFASPTWTPDSRYVITSQTGPGFGAFELWMYHVDGGSGLQLTKAMSAPETPRNAQTNSLGAVVSPDGRYLYFAQRTGAFSYNMGFPQWQIVRRDFDSGETDTLTQAPGSAIRPAISPDGKSLVYGTRFDTQTGLRVRDLETGEDRWLIYPVQRDEQESRATRDTLPGYSFLPDSSAIVLSYGGKIHRVTLTDGAATEIPFSATIEQNLGPPLHVSQRVDEGPIRARLIQSPTQSPDGGRLAFSSLTALYVLDLPDGAPRHVDTGERPAFHPAWSPDGEWLAYVTWGPDGGGLWKVRADGTQPAQQLAEASFFADPVWSLDGDKIVALRASAYERQQTMFDFFVPGLDVVWVDASGGPAHLVIPSRGVGSPHFGKERDRIYAYLNTGSTQAPHGLVSFRFDGTDRKTHLKVSGKGLHAHSQPIPANDLRVSPQGDRALAHVESQLYLITLPPFGGEPPEINIAAPAVPIKKITTIGADYFDWADGGDTMTWAVGSTFFRQPSSSVTFEKKEEEPDAQDDSKKRKKKKKAEEETEEAEEEEILYEAIEVAIEAPRDTPRGTLVLRGARAITMRGDEVLESADIVIEANRISAIGPSGEVDLPEGAHTVDLAGTTVVPGFIDTHAHWFEIRRGVLDVQNWSFLANLAYGVTAGLDVQTATNDMFAYQDLADAGAILGPRAFSTGPGVFSDNNFQSKKQALGVLKRYRDHYRTRNLKAYVSGTRKQRHFVAQAARELGMMPTTEGSLDLKLNITHALDGFAGTEHALPVVPLFRDVIELVAQTKIGYTPTLLVSYGGPFAENYFYVTEEVHDDEKLRRFVPHGVLDQKTRRLDWFREDEHIFPMLAEEAAKIHRAGGLVGVGAHGQLQGLGYHWEMWALASGGLTPHEVLRCATQDGAQIIGYGDELGSLEPGKLADLVILDENPLDDIRNTNTVRYVVKNGELFEGDTLDEIWPEKKELPTMWWQAEELP